MNTNVHGNHTSGVREMRTWRKIAKNLSFNNSMIILREFVKTDFFRILPIHQRGSFLCTSFSPPLGGSVHGRCGTHHHFPLCCSAYRESMSTLFLHPPPGSPPGGASADRCVLMVTVGSPSVLHMEMFW
jgi:hypothetical protein